MRQLRVILILITCLLCFASAHANNAAPLYLSFEQREAMSYVLLAEGADEDKKAATFARLKVAVTKAQTKGVNEITVRNFDEFMKVFRGDWPNTQSLELDMQLVEQRESRGVPTFKCPSPRVQKQIDQYLITQKKIPLQSLWDF